MIADGSGTYIYVLDHDSVYNGAVSSATNPNPNCANALTGSTTCGDITAFKIDSTTGRLQLVVNAQVTAAGGGAALPYFPVPSNPVDFVLSGGNLLTLSGTTAAASYPYTGGSTVFPYSYSSSNGQLTVNQNNAQALNIAEGTAIVGGGSYIWVLDNEPISVSGVTASQSQILPYTIGSGGSLSAATSGPIPDDATQSNPIYLVVESKGKWFYVANEGNNVIGTGTAESGLAGYYLESPFEPQEIPGEPIGFGSGPGPQCLVEDPSNQFIYTANANSSTVTGQVIDENAGVLTQFAKAPASYALAGPPTWCLVDGRTN
jgi:6-phosphogluconolactonase (cycloisomerase 2 family)